MLTYAHRDKTMEKFCFDYKDHFNCIMLDSGAWTLNSNRKKYEKIITFRGYKSFLKIIAPRVDHYYNFDEDFSKNGFETNLRNQLDLEDAGFNPIPVIHDCKGEEIQYYIDEGYDYVAIGSGELAYAPVYKLKGIVENLYNNGVKVHFLGKTDFKKLALMPVYSCDSSTWAQAGSRGNHINYWNPKRMRFDKTDNVYLDKDFLKKYPFRLQFEEYINREFGFYLEDLLDKTILLAVRQLCMQMLNIHYFVVIEKLISEKHQELGYKF